MSQHSAHQSGSPVRLASQIQNELNRMHHASDLTADEGALELERVSKALEELRGLKSTRRDTQGLLASLPILAVAFGRKHGIRVSIGGNQACTDGKRIQLPTLPMDAPHVLRALVLGYLYHETGHIETTDMDVFKKAASESPLLRNLLNVVEDIRMEAWRNAKYPGSAAVLRDLAGVIQASGKFGDLESISQAEPAQVLAMSMLTALRYRELDQPTQAVAALWNKRFIEQFGEALAIKVEVITTGVAHLKDTAASLKVARQLAAALKEEQERQEEESKSSPDSENSGDNEGSSSESGGDSDAGEQDGSEEGDASGHDDAQASEDGSDTDEDSGDDNTESSAGGQGDSEGGDASGDDAQVPEGDARTSSSGSGGDNSPMTPEQRQALKEAIEGDDEAYGDTDLGDTLKGMLESAAEEAVQQECQGGAYPVQTPGTVAVGANMGFNELALVAEASQKLRLRLASKLQADARRKRTHVAQGQRLDGQVLHRLFTNESRVFLRKEVKRDVSTAIQILLDRSGSMQGHKIEIARQATLAVALGLGQIPRVKSAACAFPDILILKQWEEHVRQVASRFPVNVDGFTPMAQAMLWGAANLASRREERKLMIVITDGAPDNAQGVRTMVRKLSQGNVECIGIGIGHDAVRTLFPQWAVIQSVDELASALFDVVGKNLTGGRIAA
ncbi:MAG: hypothetical protein BGP25_05025 [Lysobacterales bacterium 63-13]|nr:MAG: hypothetical protein BGP25_05025 [Xanthomonadales bacterium 63-13]